MPGTQVPDAKPAQQAGTLERDHAGEAQSAGRPRVRFTLHRVRLLDTDAKWGSVKDALDGLAIAKLIPGDREDQITLDVRQEKVASFKEEKTMIEIEYANAVPRDLGPVFPNELAWARQAFRELPTGYDDKLVRFGNGIFKREENGSLHHVRAATPDDLGIPELKR